MLIANALVTEIANMHSLLTSCITVSRKSGNTTHCQYESGFYFTHMFSMEIILDSLLGIENEFTKTRQQSRRWGEMRDEYRIPDDI